jgi:hypothetical protein
MHSEKNAKAKPKLPNEESAGLVEALVNANGDHGHNEMLFSPVKGKRSNCFFLPIWFFRLAPGS